MACNIDIRVVSDKAEGHWPFIYAHLAPELTMAVKFWGKHVACPHPGHKDSSDAFRLFDRDQGIRGGGVCNTCGAFQDGFSVLRWLKGWSFPEVIEQVANVLGITSDMAEAMKRRQKSPAETKEARRRQEEAESLLRAEDVSLRSRLNQLYNVEGHRLGDPEAEVARMYLRRQGLWDQTFANRQCLRFHPALAYTDRVRDYVGKFPAIMAQIVDPMGRGVTFHRHFLTSEGYEAPVDEPNKRMLVPNDRSLRGSAVRLSPAAPILGVATDIETAMAVELGTGHPTWACLTASLLEGFEPPPGVHTVIIWADKNKSGRGEEAAKVLQARLWKQEIRARIRVPTLRIPDGQRQVTWADVLLAEGRAGFPEGRYHEAVA